MSKDARKNVPHSIFERLLNLAKARNEDFNLLLSRYALERFLYRLGVSSAKESFVLKGASLLLVWTGENYRVTRDADLLGYGSPDAERFDRIFREICGITCPDDGMIYSGDTLQLEEIREGNEYKGVRIRLTGCLHTARVPVQIDIGFGDAITPAPEEIQYPTLFNGPPPELKAYPRYTMVAEKLEAIVHLGLANSRMKDFYDVWLLSTLFSFEGKILTAAIRATFSRRQTPLPSGIPFAFTAEFYEDKQKNQQWRAFLKRATPIARVNELSEIIKGISAFLMPALDNLQSSGNFEAEWMPEKGWRRNDN